MACTCGPCQQCDPLKPGCWGYQAPSPTTMKLGSIGAYALRGGLAKYVTEQPNGWCCHKTRVMGSSCPIGWKCPFMKEGAESV